MLEDIFIIQPQEKVGRLTTKALMALGAGATGGGAYFASTLLLNNYAQPDGNTLSSYLSRKHTHITVGSGILSGLYTFLALRAYLLEIEEKKQLVCLMDNWEQAKEFLPSQLVTGLTKLAHQYRQKGPYYVQHADEALRLIKNAIYEHFPRIYTKKKWYDIFSEKRFYVYTYLNLDLLDLAGKAIEFAKRLIS